MSTSHHYLCLLRGINVGGHSLIKMLDLKDCLITAGLTDVKTYIQSGNILFTSKSSDTVALTTTIEKAIDATFSMQVPAVVFSEHQWEEIIEKAPKWWGNDKSWKHNVLVLLPPYDMQETIAAIGILKPDIEKLESGDGVLYQAMSLALFGKTTTGKLSASPIYKRMTVRNYNTATKLLALLKAQQ